MISQRINAFCQGYLVAMVQGARTEEFLNQGLAAGAMFWDIKRKAPGIIIFKTYASQFTLLRPCFFQTRTQGKILRRRGWPFILRRVWQKKGWLLGMVLFLSLLLSLSSLIWFIEVSGVEELLDQTGVRQELASLGLSPGVARHKIEQRRDWLIRELRIRLPEALWITLRIKGVVAEVIIVEKTPPPPQVEAGGNLVAVKEGLITSILVLEGTPLVREGDTVAQGELLIMGETGYIHLDGSVEVKKVKARGQVHARVWNEVVIEEPLTVLVPKVIGGQKTVYSFRVGPRLFPLFSRGKVGGMVRQERAVKTIIPGRNSLSLVEIVKDTFQTVDWITAAVRTETALARARKKAEERIGLALLSGGQSETIREFWEVQSKVLYYRLILETEEEIAVPD
jgi:similar to stage IV sporulation protein